MKLKKSSREVIIRLIVAIVATCFTIILCEFGLRLYYFGSVTVVEQGTVSDFRQPHPSRGWALAANYSRLLRTKDFTVLVETNSRGFRDIEHSIEKPEGSYRIVVLGDSFMEAYQVPLEESFSRVLEYNLKKSRNDVEVINLGVGGYGTTQEYLTLIEEGFNYDPDLILLAYLPTNDLRNNHPKLEKLLWRGETLKTFGRPYASIGLDNNIQIISPDFERAKAWTEKQKQKRKEKLATRNFWEQFEIFHLFETAKQGFQEKTSSIPSYDPNVLYGPYLLQFDSTLGGDKLPSNEYQKLREEAYQITEALFVAMNNKAQEYEADFIIFTVPARPQVDTSYLKYISNYYPSLDFDITLPNQRIVNLCQTNDIIITDILPAFQHAYTVEGKSLHYQIDDRHWNSMGHELAAREIAKFIQKETFFNKVK